MAERSIRRGVGRIHKIYRYVVKFDTGVAPNVAGGICTLALCKPAIRRCAQKDNWIVGLWPAPDRMCVTFVMRVGKVVPLALYWGDPDFSSKKPRASPTPDNVYRPGRNGKLKRVNTWVHPKVSDMERDRRGRNVLIADRFWYFGGVRSELPSEFRCLDLTGSRRGHQIAEWEDRTLDAFIAWLNSCGRGVIGKPRDEIPARGRRCT